MTVGVIGGAGPWRGAAQEDRGRAMRRAASGPKEAIRIVPSIAESPKTGQTLRLASLYPHEAIDIDEKLGQAAAIHQDRLRDRPEDAGAT
ncbi:hypothetical protein GCM10023307_19000 [Lysobacter hankyongensis]|uniref:Uncharacterized protein n=1 Tax=Lysobacter hankyongensis TaxID=1176535 RepID=A0ABP9BF65_9GAMM